MDEEHVKPTGRSRSYAESVPNSLFAVPTQINEVPADNDNDKTVPRTDIDVRNSLLTPKVPAENDKPVSQIDETTSLLSPEGPADDDKTALDLSDVVDRKPSFLRRRFTKLRRTQQQAKAHNSSGSFESARTNTSFKSKSGVVFSYTQWIVFLYHRLLPTILILSCVLRVTLISLIYLLIFMTSHVGTLKRVNASLQSRSWTRNYVLLIFSGAVVVLMIIAQITYAIVAAVNPDSSVLDLQNLRIMRQIGFSRLNVNVGNDLRFVIPDVLVFVICFVGRYINRQLRQSQTVHTDTHNVTPWKATSIDVVTLTAVCLVWINLPAWSTAIYLLAFLGISRNVIAYKKGLSGMPKTNMMLWIYSAVHIVIMYLYQFDVFQKRIFRQPSSWVPTSSPVSPPVEGANNLTNTTTSPTLAPTLFGDSINFRCIGLVKFFNVGELVDVATDDNYAISGGGNDWIHIMAIVFVFMGCARGHEGVVDKATLLGKIIRRCSKEILRAISFNSMFIVGVLLPCFYPCWVGVGIIIWTCFSWHTESVQSTLPIPTVLLVIWVIADFIVEIPAFDGQSTLPFGMNHRHQDVKRVFELTIGNNDVPNEVGILYSKVVCLCIFFVARTFYTSPRHSPGRLDARDTDTDPDTQVSNADAASVSITDASFGFSTSSLPAPLRQAEYEPASTDPPQPGYLRLMRVVRMLRSIALAFLSRFRFFAYFIIVAFVYRAVTFLLLVYGSLLCWVGFSRTSTTTPRKKWSLRNLNREQKRLVFIFWNEIVIVTIYVYNLIRASSENCGFTSEWMRSAGIELNPNNVGECKFEYFSMNTGDAGLTSHIVIMMMGMLDLWLAEILALLYPLDIEPSLNLKRPHFDEKNFNKTNDNVSVDKNKLFGSTNGKVVLTTKSFSFNTKMLVKVSNSQNVYIGMIDKQFGDRVWETDPHSQVLMYNREDCIGFHVESRRMFERGFLSDTDTRVHPDVDVSGTQKLEVIMAYRALKEGERQQYFLQIK